MRRLSIARRTGVVVLAGIATSLIPTAPAGAATPAYLSSPIALSAGVALNHKAANLPIADIDQAFDAVATAKGKLVRIEINWASVEATRGIDDWTKVDRLVDAAHRHGLTAIGLVSFTPAWARPAGTGQATPPTDPATYASFLARAALRYGGQGLKVWEIWNEPNIAQFWRPAPNPVAYAALLRAAYNSLKQVQPGAVVLHGGMSPQIGTADGTMVAQTTFLARVYAAGGGPYFDAVAMHPYCYCPEPMDPATSKWNAFYNLPRLYQVMVDNGNAWKAVWITEIGQPTTGHMSLTEAQQAHVVEVVYRQMKQWTWLRAVLWYTAKESEWRSDGTRDWGLLRSDWSVKPALTSYRTVLAEYR